MVKVLGLEGYLRLVSRTYIQLIRFGFFKKKHAELHFIRSVLKHGDQVMDIGANLGYYSFQMSVAVSSSGKVLAVEPIPLFADIWKRNVQRYVPAPAKLVNCAIGNEDRKDVDMTIPIVDGLVRHGLTKISSADSAARSHLRYKVKMRSGDAIFDESGMTNLNFIKCDVEGYEQFVIPSLSVTIRKFWPLIQIELSGDENRKCVVELLKSMNYHMFCLVNERFKPIEKSDIFTIGRDFYFIHASRLNEWKKWIDPRS